MRQIDADLPPLPDHIRYKVMKRTWATTMSDEYFWDLPEMAPLKPRYGHLPTLTVVVKEVIDKEDFYAYVGWMEDWEGLHGGLGRLLIGTLSHLQSPGHSLRLYREGPLSGFPDERRVDETSMSFDYKSDHFFRIMSRPNVNEWMDSCLIGIFWPEDQAPHKRTFRAGYYRSYSHLVQNSPLWFEIGFDFDGVTFIAPSTEWMEKLEEAVEGLTRGCLWQG